MLHEALKLRRRFIGTKGEGKSFREALRSDVDLTENTYALILEYYRSSDKDQEFKQWAKSNKKVANEKNRRDWVNKQAKEKFNEIFSSSIPDFEVCSRLSIPFPAKSTEYFCSLSGRWVDTDTIIGSCHKCQYPLTITQDTCPNCQVGLALDKCRHCGGGLVVGEEIEFCKRHAWEHRYF